MAAWAKRDGANIQEYLGKKIVEEVLTMAKVVGKIQEDLGKKIRDEAKATFEAEGKYQQELGMIIQVEATKAYEETQKKAKEAADAIRQIWEEWLPLATEPIKAFGDFALETWTFAKDKFSEATAEVVVNTGSFKDSIVGLWEDIKIGAVKFLTQLAIETAVKYAAMAASAVLFSSTTVVANTAVATSNTAVATTSTGAGAAMTSMSTAIPVLLAIAAAALAIAAAVYTITQAVKLLIEKWPELKEMFKDVFGAAGLAIEGFLKGLSSAFKAGFDLIGNIVSGIGSTITTIFDTSFKVVAGILNGVLKTIETVFSAIGKVVEVVANTIGKAFEIAFNIIHKLKELLFQNFKGVFGGIGSIVGGVAGGITQAFTASFGVISAGLKGITSAVSSVNEGIKSAVPSIGQTIGRLPDGIRTIMPVQGVSNLIKDIGNTVGNIASNPGGAVTNAVKDIGQSLGIGNGNRSQSEQHWSNVDSAWRSIAASSMAQTFYAARGNTGYSMPFLKVLTYWKDAVNPEYHRLLKAGGEWEDTKIAWVKDATIWKGAPPGAAEAGLIAALAHGGIVTGPTLAMIGEAGPEAVIPLSRGRAAMGGLGGDIHIHFDGNNIIDEISMNRFTRKIIDSIQREAGRLAYG